MGKNMKMQDEHGQIFVSGALDPRKMISEKIPEISGGVQPKLVRHPTPQAVSNEFGSAREG